MSDVSGGGLDLAEEKKKSDAPSYKPTPKEREAVEAFFANKGKAKPSPNLSVRNERGKSIIELDHADATTAAMLLMDAIGTTSGAFLDGLLSQIANAASKGVEAEASAINFMLAIIKGIEPKDQVEAMLAAQMAAVHNATMTFARRLNHVDNIPQQDSASNAFNKLARTFAAQMEALRRYRNGGEQRVTVQHVTVNDGGRAIVGALSTGGGGHGKNEEQPHAKQITHAPGQAVPGNVETVKAIVPVASR